MQLEGHILEEKIWLQRYNLQIIVCKVIWNKELSEIKKNKI
jgi:hypothetical protein